MKQQRRGDTEEEERTQPSSTEEKSRKEMQLFYPITFLYVKGCVHIFRQIIFVVSVHMFELMYRIRTLCYSLFILKLIFTI